MNDRDDELDRLLKPLNELKPSRQQMARWQSIAPMRNRGWQKQIIQVAAAAFVGFIMGAWYISNHESNQQVADNFDAGATVEMIYSKSE